MMLETHYPEPSIDLHAPFEQDVILEVRHGRLKTMPGLDIPTGIEKSIHEGSIWVGRMGIKEDEHDLTFHGGIDKAVHGYCSSHYPSWKAEFPSAAERFVPGGFGENLVTARMNERNVCIGDVVAIGEGSEPLLLQVSLPRQPCFKLNHRFKLKNFAPNTWRLSRTGWYYRVLREGPVQAGDTIRLHERRWPDWTIERVQEYLHRHTDDENMNALLADISDMGAESRGAFQRRVDKAKAKTEEAKGQKWTDYRVVKKTKQTSRITSFAFEPVDSTGVVSQPAHGAHVKVRLGNGLVRAYSIVCGDRSHFELGISLDENSRGGSKYLHENVNPGDTIQVGTFTEGVKPNGMSSNHVFVAGGVGITAFLAFAKAMVHINWSVEIHYAVRSADEVPFRAKLDELGNRVRIYDRSKSERLSIDSIIRNMPWNSMLYFCGPQRMMDEALLQTKKHGIPDSETHFEAFSADTGGDPFEVLIQSENTTLKIEEDETLLDVLKRNFDDVQSSCEVGNCGTCKVKLISGKVEHRGMSLTNKEKESTMLSCVSRGVGKITIDF